MLPPSKRTICFRIRALQKDGTPVSSPIQSGCGEEERLDLVGQWPRDRAHRVQEGNPGLDRDLLHLPKTLRDASYSDPKSSGSRNV